MLLASFFTASRPLFGIVLTLFMLLQLLKESFKIKAIIKVKIKLIPNEIKATHLYLSNHLDEIL